MLVEVVKSCAECGQSKPAGDFHLSSTNADGLQPYCKECKRAQARRRRERLMARDSVSAPRHKRCCACGLDLPSDRFYGTMATLDGLDSKCKACSAAYSLARGRKLRARSHIISPEAKSCRMCGEERPASKFTVDRQSPDGLNARCRKCCSISNAASVYGIDISLARTLRDWPACDICGDGLVDDTRCIDHCHSTGIVRGVLCTHCNTMLGFARDNQGTLQAAMAYLQRAAQKSV